MNETDLHAVVKSFLDLLENGKQDEQENIRALELALDRLALAYDTTVDAFDDGQPDSPSEDYARFRTLASARFPRFGLYNTPGAITSKIMQAEMMVGDALDDVADIACELAQVAWCWEHTSDKDALWHFRFGYENHWEGHLRHLQLYLYALRTES